MAETNPYESPQTAPEPKVVSKFRIGFLQQSLIDFKSVFAGCLTSLVSLTVLLILFSLVAYWLDLILFLGAGAAAIVISILAGCVVSERVDRHEIKKLTDARDESVPTP